VLFRNTKIEARNNNNQTVSRSQCN